MTESLDGATATAVRQPRQQPMFVTVTAVRRLSERMARITLTGEEIVEFDYDGPDHLARVFFPVCEDFRLPVTEQWWPELQAMPVERRPVMRNYTVRRMDYARGEMDIDFVLHGDSGPASAWACAAKPGDRIGVLSDGAEYKPGDADWQLLIGDETAIPAIAGMLENLRTPAHTVFEVADELDVIDVAAPATWLYRGSGARGAEVLEALRGMTFPEGKPYVWVAGESTLATSVRRYLVNERSIDKKRIYFCGYWRADRPAYD
ncbi:siderophore-interacting protein [Kibdelosporangium phytohabitans]|uniref:Siderophore-interacting protein n=1 Tax=Kibdelosporangium phytohabitans TaxID=860235 RepID=A0A0N7F3G9_9PSEU|nr:siderophore-interacting protein [Kibdelosporangium phytohabitans]ALG08599.1 siderophore-interacting protein [Kibdelosporangium phytohabitans]MBE1470319.1 NADPH-dependent ferric siderophore reductase [Kibdelosporangium phytohabitans]